MFTIILSNMRKRKSRVAILLILIMLSAMLLNIGITVFTQLGSFYDKKAEELKTPDIAYFISTKNVDRFISKAVHMKEIKNFETKDALYYTGVQIKNKNKNGHIEEIPIIMNAKSNSKMAPLKIIEKSKVKSKNSILLPYMFKTTHGYNIDDEITLKIKDKIYKYRIYGFFENVLFGAPTMSVNTIYLYDKAYNELSSKAEHGKLLYIKAKSHKDISKILKHNHVVNNSWSDYIIQIGNDIESTKYGIIIFPNIIAMVMIVFSFIMVIIGLIVVRFSIITSIDEGIKNIGVLKAAGYKSSQIVGSFLLQYLIIAAAGCIAGLAASTFALPVLGGIAGSSSGLQWSIGVNIVSMTISLVIVLFLTLFVALINAGGARKITPIMALRQGIETHSFKRNFFPLSKSTMNVNLVISLKSIMSNLKQNIMILVILAALGFASVFSSVLYFNMVKEPKAFVNLVGFPSANIWLEITQYPGKSGNFDNIFKEISQMKCVKKVVPYAQRSVDIKDSVDLPLILSNNFNRTDKKTIYAGRYPKYDNEISIANSLADKYNKKIGDSISLTINNKTKGYIITGLTQQVNNGGNIVDMTESGYKHFNKKYITDTVTIFLNKGTNTKKFINKLNNKYPNLKKKISNVEETLGNQLSSFKSAVAMLMILIVIMTIVVICLILYLVIRVKIMADKTNLGIFKSLGYTTKQLVIQISLSFTLVMGFGAMIGCVLGTILSNKTLALLTSSIGIKNIRFVINYRYVFEILFGIIVLSFMMSFLVALRVRKITPYSLITE